MYFYYYYYYYLPKARRARGGAGPYWSWKKLPGRLLLYSSLSIQSLRAPSCAECVVWGGDERDGVHH